MRFLLKPLILAFCLFPLSVLAGSADLAHARVQASHAALQSAERDYRLSRSRGDLSATEASDYEAYIAQLRRRFFGACAELAQFLETGVHRNTPCPSSLPRVPRAAKIESVRDQTRGERTTALTSDLDAALSDFDEMLLREQERVKAATPPAAARSAGGAGQGGPSADGSGSADMAGGRRGPDEGLPGSGGTGEGATTGVDAGAAVTAAGSGAGEAPPGRPGADGRRRQTAMRDVPPDIPDGSDDDVVARQLREAAEKENNPELRARLWEEYRRYKRGTP